MPFAHVYISALNNHQSNSHELDFQSQHFGLVRCIAANGYVLISHHHSV